MTDARGQFALKDLDPELTFRLLAVAEGFLPTHTPKHVDPKAGPVTFALKPHDLDRRDPALVLKGRVLDEEGRPVPGAVVEPFGFGKGDGTQFGGLDGFDPLALSDDKGVFRLGVPEKGVAVYAQVSARFMAPHKFHRLVAGPQGHDLKLFAGVTVTGRIVKDGRPLAGVAVGLAQSDRNAETFIGEFQNATDEKGVFRIPNVPPRDQFVLYGLMDSLRPHGAITVQKVATGASGTEVDAGELAVRPGHRLTGRVVLSDGKPVPAGTRVVVSRDEAWDSQQAVVDKDGNFAFTGLPPERYSLSANVRGYRASPKNASYDLLNQMSLEGMVKEDITGLRLLLEPGGDREWKQPSQEDMKEYQRRRDAPLRGAP